LTERLPSGLRGLAKEHADGRREILLAPGLSGQARLATLVHEMLHHCDFRHRDLLMMQQIRDLTF